MLYLQNSFVNKNIAPIKIVIVFLLVIYLIYPSKIIASDQVQKWNIGKPIVGYWAGPSPLTEYDVNQMREGNWNLAWVTPRGNIYNKPLVSYFLEQLDLLEKYNLRGIVVLGKFINRRPSVNSILSKRKVELTNFISKLKNHKALYAYHLIDEPSSKIFNNLAILKEYILKIDPKHLVYVNLYPNYASKKQLGVNSYMEYIQLFSKIYKPQLLSYDYYAFNTNKIREGYFKNLIQIRSEAMQRGIPFMNILQASSWTSGKRIPTGQELRWQMYTSLAYGAKGIFWYVYGYRGHDGGMIYPNVERKNGKLLVTGGEPTPLYYYASKVNKEFLILSSELKGLYSMGGYHVGTIPKGAMPVASNLKFKISSSSPTNKDKLPKKSFLIGTFGNGNDITHAIIVNLDTRTYSGKGHARRSEFFEPKPDVISSSSCLDIFDLTRSKWSHVNTKKIQIKLPPGKGVLIRQSYCR